MKNNLFLITSGAYSSDEISSDFGLLPTSFLPVGHSRLFEHQINLIKGFEGERYISLPEKYNLLNRDKQIFSNNKINIHYSNPNINLCQSIFYFLENININKYSNLFILHGDTLFDKISYEADILYYGFTDTFYKWGELNFSDIKLKKQNSSKAVISGYFSFSNINLLKKILLKSDSFELALKEYNNSIKLKLIECQGWLDFGHSNLYYKSKRNLNVARSFNKVIVENNSIRKQSNSISKIKNEFNWFKNLPEKIRLYCPSVMDYVQTEENASYLIEFVGAPTLQEKFVFGNLPDYIYFKIIDKVFEFIKISKSIRLKDNKFNSSLKKLYLEKTEKRVQSFISTINLNVNDRIYINNKSYISISHFAQEILDFFKNYFNNYIDQNHLSFMHGDLCFSNILYDSRSGNIKLIDPRGGLSDKFEDKFKIYGDYKYDIAKLGHSLIGNYDYIVAGFYNLKIDSKNLDFSFGLQAPKRPALYKYFYHKCETIGVTKEFIRASITNLFLSMLPLHSEDKNRQIALMLNAYLFYYE